jgi:hypothetical protein
MEMVSVCVSIENDLFNGKRNVPVLLIKHHNTKTYDGMKVEHHPFVGSVLHASEWSASRSALSTGNSQRYPLVDGTDTRYGRSREDKNLSCELSSNFLVTHPGRKLLYHARL